MKKSCVNIFRSISPNEFTVGFLVSINNSVIFLHRWEIGVYLEIRPTWARYSETGGQVKFPHLDSDKTQSVTCICGVQVNTESCIDRYQWHAGLKHWFQEGFKYSFLMKTTPSPLLLFKKETGWPQKPDLGLRNSYLWMFIRQFLKPVYSSLSPCFLSGTWLIDPQYWQGASPADLSLGVPHTHQQYRQSQLRNIRRWVSPGPPGEFISAHTDPSSNGIIT